MTTKTHSKIPVRWIVLAAVVVVLGLVAWRVTGLLGGAGNNHDRSTNVMEVDAVRVSRQSVPLVLHAAGTVQTFHSVAVRPQVGGVLQKVLFNEGDEVKAGQLLFVIDPRPYQVQVAEAQGQLEQDKAKLNSDRTNAERSARLVKQGYVSGQDNQNAQALVEQDTGKLAADQAALDNAELQLGYTKIRAPISGKTGALAYKSGNLLQANDTTALVTINQIAPIQVQFQIPQSQIALLQRYRQDPALNVFVNSPNGSLVANNGKLAFIDNSINPDSGTLTLKANFSNKQHQLLPGELVHVGLQLTVQPNLVVIPTTAVQPGQQGNYVYLIKNDKVTVRNVKVLRQYGDYAVIGEGLNDDDEVVVRIPRDLHEGLAAHANLMPAVTLTASAASSASTITAASATSASD
ncbi:MAG: efflux RND transporter periplasmic adaptor subunit [Gammaproteobacteria bacterium]